MKKVTVIGGGTGNFVVLSGLKNYPLDLSVIVSMMDSGGSTGKLRDQLGVLPPGDLRQCLVALSDAPLLWRKLFLYRFENGDLKGHNFGNVFLSALEKVSPDYKKVIETASYVLKTKGKVIPVTLEKTNLCVKYSDGKTIKGESNIDTNNQSTGRIINAFLEPKIIAASDAIEAIDNSDCIIVSPGDIYTSIIPVLLSAGIKKAIINSHAKIIYVLNLMTKLGQTNNYKATDFLHDLKKYLGKNPDYIIVNNGKIPEVILRHYMTENDKPVKNDLNLGNFQGQIISDDFLEHKSFTTEKSDSLKRSILRHNPKKLAEVIYKIITSPIP